MTTPEYLQGVVAVFEEDRYDDTLSGHAWYQDQYCYFILDNRLDNDDWVYNVYSLTDDNIIRAMAVRQAFKDIVQKKYTSNWHHFYDSYNFKFEYNELLGKAKSSEINWQLGNVW